MSSVNELSSSGLTPWPGGPGKLGWQRMGEIACAVAAVAQDLLMEQMEIRFLATCLPFLPAYVVCADQFVPIKGLGQRSFQL